MTIISGLFNSINGDRKYLAEHFAMYFSTFIGDGVFPNPSNGLQVIADGTGLNVKVRPGRGWIKGYFLFSDADYTLPIQPANAVQNRIDRVVMRLDFLDRTIKIQINQGTPSATPVAPVLQRDSDAYELALADIFITRNALVVSQSNITDQRLNTSLCGIVHGTVNQVDTTTIFNQYQDWFTEYSVTKAQEFLEWQTRVTTEIEDWINMQEVDFLAWRDIEENLYYEWLEARKNGFDEWFATIKDILDDNAAGNIMLELDEHRDSNMPHKMLVDSTVYKYGFVFNPTLRCISCIMKEEV